jgi:hypothetical protein
MYLQARSEARRRMYVCMYLYMYLCMYVYIYVCIQLSVEVYYRPITL